MRQQSLQLGLQLSSKYVPRMVRSIGQISVGITRFPVYPEREFWETMHIKQENVEVQEIDSAMLLMIEFIWIFSMHCGWRALPFQLNIGLALPNLARNFQSST